MTNLEFSIDSVKKPELYVNSFVNGEYNCSLYFRIIATGYNNVSEIDNLFFDFKIKETLTSYDFYTGYNSNNIEGRVFSDFFKYDSFRQCFYTDLIFNFKTTNYLQSYSNYNFNINYSYEIVRFLRNNSAFTDFIELFNCFGGIKTLSKDLKITNIDSSNIHLTPLPQQITETLSIKNIDISYATEQERLLKTKVLQKKLSQEQLSKFFSGVYYSRDLYDQSIKGYFLFNKNAFIDYVFPKTFINLLKNTQTNLTLKARVKVLDNSDNIIKEYENKDSSLINPINSRPDLFVVNKIIPQADIYKIGLKSYVEIDMRLNTEFKNKIESDFNRIGQAKNIADKLTYLLSDNYDSNFDIYERVTDTFQASLIDCINNISKEFILYLLSTYYSYTIQESNTFIDGLFGLLGLESDRTFKPKNKPENITLFVDIIDSLYREVKRFRDTFEDFEYFYTYKFNNEYDHSIPMNSGLVVFEKSLVPQTYRDQSDKLLQYSSLFTQYYSSIDFNDINKKFLSARRFIVEGRTLDWDTFETRESFLTGEINLKNHLLKIKKENLGLYADNVQPFSKSSILVYGNNGIPNDVLSLLNKISKYKQTKEIRDNNIVKDNITSNILYYRVPFVEDQTQQEKSSFESYTELFFPTYFLQFLDNNNTWQDVTVITDETGNISITPNTGFFKIKRYSDETFNYTFSSDVEYPLYDEYFVLPFRNVKPIYSEPYEPIDLSDPNISTVRIPNATRSTYPDQNLELSVKDSVPPSNPPIQEPPIQTEEPVPPPTADVNIGDLPDSNNYAPPATDGQTESTPPPEEIPKQIPPQVPQYITADRCTSDENPLYIVETNKGEYFGYFVTLEDAIKQEDLNTLYTVSNTNDVTKTDQVSLKLASKCQIIKKEEIPKSYPEITSCGETTNGFVVKTIDGKYYFFFTEAEYKAAFPPEQVSQVKKINFKTLNLTEENFTNQKALALVFTCQALK
jgi:hypothetical protein